MRAGAFLKNSEKSGTPVHVEEKKQQYLQVPLIAPDETQ